MAVPEQTPYIEHTGNGVTTSFSLGFQCESKDHLIVLVDDIEPPIATWSLTGGNVVFTTAPAAGKKITLQRNTPFNRTAEYQTFNNSFRPQSVNGDFDRLWLKLQELGVADWLMKLYVDRLHQQQEQKINDLKGYVDDRDDELRAYLMDEIRKQGVALDQLDEYYNYLMQQLAQIAVNRGWDASFIADAGGSTQQDINDFGGSKWRNKAGGYALGATVKLDNGDIVKSTINGNTNDPNVSIEGWVFPAKKLIGSVAELRANTSLNPNATVFEYNTETGVGGGDFYADGADTTSADNGVTVFVDTRGTRWKRNKTTLSFADFGCVDGIDNTQALARMAAYLSNNGGVIEDYSGAEFTSTLPINITAPRKNIKISTNCTISSTDKQVTIAGTRDSLGSLSVPALRGGNTIQVADATGIISGDVLIIQNSLQYSFNEWRANYYDGEFVRVKSVSGNVISLQSPILSSYSNGATDKVFKLNPVNLHLDGGSFLCNGTYSLQVKHAVDSKIAPKLIKNNSSLVSSAGGLGIDQSYNIQVPSGEFYKKYNVNSGLDYGISVANSQLVNIGKGVTSFGGRHAVATGGSAGDGCAPCRFIRVEGATLFNDLASGVHAADFHGNTADSHFKECIINGTIAMGGERNYSIENTYNPDPSITSGICQYAEICGEIGFIDDELLSTAQTDAVYRITTSAGLDQITKPISVFSKGCSFKLGNKTKFLLAPAVSKSKSKWSISDFSISGDMSALIRIISGGTTAEYVPPDYIECVSPKSYVPPTLLEIYLPAGAMIGVQKRVYSSQGSNANGRYYKREDCSMVCTHEITLDTAINVAFLGGFKSTPITWTFPFPFEVGEKPTIEITPIGAGAFGAVIETVTNTGCTIALTAVATQVLASRKFQIKATANFIRM